MCIRDSEKTVTKSSKPKSKFRKQKEKTLQDLFLFIPSKENPRTFIGKTIGECTGAEFMRWSSFVFAPPIENRDFYENKRNRENEFLNILDYHRELFARINPEASKTYH